MIITLCGSTKFEKKYKFWNFYLTLSGHIVLSCSIMGHSENKQLDRIHKAKLDVMHFQKIDMSDAIFVINPGGYIGESTEREIIYAEQKGKDIYYLSEFGGGNILYNDLIFFSVKKYFND